MLPLKTLGYLTSQKTKDASILFRSGRYSGAVYLMGYALEFNLKRKISQTLGFTNGFPEDRNEPNSYGPQIIAFNAISTGLRLTKIKDIRNHDLNLLIKYSGAESRIVASYYSEWLTIKDWNPEDRYKIRKYRLSKARDFLQSAKIILAQIH